MDEKSTLYWTHLETFEACGQRFLWRYGWGLIDLGRGPGKGKAMPEEESRHHAVMGIVIQAAVEKLYNEELWRDPKNLAQTLRSFVPAEWVRQENKKRNQPIDFEKAQLSRADMIEICQDGVSNFLKTMKAQKFLGPYAKAEVPLIGWVDKWTAIGGRADTIIRRDDTGVTILDGKNTRHRMKYTDPDQLRWYALVFKLAYRVMPDRLGFVWYRFPPGSELLDEDGDPLLDDKGKRVLGEGVEWIPFTEEDLKGLAKRAVDARNLMRREKFEADPTPPVCRWCPFESVCPERQAQIEKNAGKRRKKKIEEFDNIEDSGFVDFSV